MSYPIDDLGMLNVQYESMVHAKFQSSQRLQGNMPEVSNQGAARVDHVSSTLEMKEVPFGVAEFDTSAYSATEVITLPLRFVIKTAFAEADQTLSNVSFMQQQTAQHGLALARMIDILKIRAVVENSAIPLTDFNTVAITEGPNTGLNSRKMTKSATILNNEDVDADSRHFWTNSDQIETLMDDDKYIRSNYVNNSPLPLQNYGVHPYAGFEKIHVLGKKGSNALPITVNPDDTQSSIAIAQQYRAMQLMYNLAPRTVVHYNPSLLAYEIISEVVANAQVIQKEGIVVVNLKLDANDNAIANP